MTGVVQRHASGGGSIVVISEGRAFLIYTCNPPALGSIVEFDAVINHRRAILNPGGLPVLLRGRLITKLGLDEPFGTNQP